MMNCQKIRTLLSDYLDGSIGVETAVRLRAHLKSCSPCREELDEMEKTVSLLSQFENSRLSRDFDSRLFQRLDVLEGSRAVPAGRKSAGSGWQGQVISLFHSPWRWAATTAAVAFVGVAGWQLQPGASPSNPTPTPSTVARTSPYLSACLEAHTSFVSQERPAHDEPGIDPVLPDETTD